MRRHATDLGLAVVLCLISCVANGNDRDGAWQAEAGSASNGQASSGGDGSEVGSSGRASSSDDGTEAEGPGSRLDLADGATGAGDDEPVLGCRKVDFLFVIDNSPSMRAKQDNLVANFPGFIEQIRDRVVDDFHIMVVDMDAQCSTAACPKTADACDHTLGAGKVMDETYTTQCGAMQDSRYLTDAQTTPALDQAFSCMAIVGTTGSSEELPIQAMLRAVNQLAAPEQCNAGFLRRDALLIATIITDEDDTSSPGDPSDWKDALVRAKGGYEEAVVVLGLIGDSGQPGAVCEFVSTNGNEADDAVRLREFVTSFAARGMSGSVCAPSYQLFFADATDLIDTACTEYQPQE